MNADEKKKLISDIESSELVDDLYGKAIKIGFDHEWRDPAYGLEGVAECMAAVGISTVSEAEKIMARHAKELEEFLKDICGNRRGHPWEVSPGFVMAFALILDRPDVFTAERLKEIGWDEDPIKQVRSALERRR
ncbi:hypothetical protein QE424_000197 [Stenotrophomonas rhizophila]|jgi:hypothetical protein|uniref:Uncharacterized protein n=1 Tax=Stenotrophomonas rhizophila TaxID=216778 RepID=A0AAP5AGC3_9GAMM|nr:hypothetical protein [Stenotrophomonas rhizophila]MDQ1107038.1 hypothetical protein [Stenotrophomonas rhizophila]